MLMARMALISIAFLPLWAACASTERDSRFAPPNALMGEEIESRISQIPYQHREELFQNLLWLAQSGESAVPALLRGCKHEDPKVRANCAWVLGEIGDRRVITDLQPMTHDSNETVRLEAARTLVVLGDIKECPPLIDALDSDKVQVRYLCHEALKSATGQDFGYDHLSDNLTQRHKAVLAWRQWWSEMAGDPWFAKTYANKHGLIDTPAAVPPAGEAMPPAPAVEPGRSAMPQGTMPLQAMPQTMPLDDGKSNPQTGLQPNPQTGMQPSQQTGMQPSQQTGTQPSQQTGMQPSQQTGTQPNPQTGMQPSQQTGMQPSQQTGTQPKQQTGMQPNPQSSTQPDQQSGTQPQQLPADSDEGIQWKEVPADPRSSGSTGQRPMTQPLPPLPKGN
jgi:hypothetical protein